MSIDGQHNFPHLPLCAASEGQSKSKTCHNYLMTITMMTMMTMTLISFISVLVEHLRGHCHLSIHESDVKCWALSGSTFSYFHFSQKVFFNLEYFA